MSKTQRVWRKICVVPFFALALILLAGSGFAASRRDGSQSDRDQAPPHGPVDAQVSVCFVPAQACDTAIADAIRDARDSIRVQAYGFTAPMILRELAAARARGVDVQAILDKSDDRRERPGARPRMDGAAFAAAAGIPTWIDDTVTIAHNKIIIIDGRVVVGGSYNYTVSAERHNAENVTFIQSPVLAGLYLANWDARKSVSRPYESAGSETGRNFVASEQDGN
jgi:phosphatidylserine/phosphatidylglycerophosphate/cardiolipin synthase-like enzyme